MTQILVDAFLYGLILFALADGEVPILSRTTLFVLLGGIGLQVSQIIFGG